MTEAICTNKMSKISSCAKVILMTCTEFYGNIKSNVVLLKKMLGTNKYHGFVDKLNSVLFVAFSTIRLLQLVICQEHIDYGTLHNVIQLY